MHIIKKFASIFKVKFVTKTRNSFEIIRPLNYSGVDIDTSKLYKEPAKNRHNKKAVEDLIVLLEKSGFHLERVKSRYLYRNVTNEFIADFIADLNVPLENKKFDVESISSFISKGEFYDKWDIVFATGEEKEANGNYFEINKEVSIYSLLENVLCK